MIYRGLVKFSLCCLMIVSVSCGSRREFVITDDYVNRETGTGSPGKETTSLTEADRKYFAVKLGVPPAQVTSDRLYLYVKANEGRAYSSGSAGVVARLYSEVYGKKVAGGPTDIMADKRLELFKSSENLREGDLVFFRASSNEVVTHVGVYLKNNRFFSGRGSKASIYNLRKGEWKNNFVAAGRFKQ